MADDHAADRMHHQGLAVLVVEDDREVAQLVGAFLRAAGHRVRLAITAEQALAEEALLADPPDLLLTDLQLPGIDGIALGHQLVGRWPHLRVLTMSATDSAEVLAGLGDIPNHIGHLEKPFRMDALLAAVAEALPARQAPPD